jgi:hypothetical protein
MLGTWHVAQVVAVHGTGAVKGDHMVYLGTDANPLTQHMVVVAGHMGHDRLARLQA